MSITVKICGLSTEASVETAVAAGADMIGFVFFPKSPRAVTFDQAAHLARFVHRPTEIVALLVDPDDATIAQLLSRIPVDRLQLHGTETPERCAAIRARFQKPVMKALGIATDDDLLRAQSYRNQIDDYLFDAKPARNAPLPGGNGIAFDWNLLSGRNFAHPWMLSGGLTAATVAHAVRTSGARAVDVSSGVEQSPGIKDNAAIRSFIAQTRTIG